MWTDQSLTGDIICGQVVEEAKHNLQLLSCFSLFTITESKLGKYLIDLIGIQLRLSSNSANESVYMQLRLALFY